MKSVSKISNDDAICLICEADISGQDIPNKKRNEMEMLMFTRTEKMPRRCVCKCVSPDTYACHVWLNENGQLNLPERQKTNASRKR